MHSNKIYIASSIDNNYAMPFAVMVASVLANISRKYGIDFFVMSDGLSIENKEKIVNSFKKDPIRFHWICPDRKKFKNLMPTEHVSLATYYRIDIFNKLPDEVDKILYLDADLIVLKDLCLLWQTDMKGKILLAVQDLSIPYIDSKKALYNFDHCKTYIESDEPIEDYQEESLNPYTKYFNAGVMVVDVQQWKKLDIEKKIVNCLLRRKDKNKYFDQDAFNIVLANQWGELDLRWNQISHFYRYPTFEKSPFDQKTFYELQDAPYIVHFASAVKPWYFGNRHKMRDKFFQYLKKTEWKKWRPNITNTLYVRGRLLFRNLQNLCRHRLQSQNKKDFFAYCLCLSDVCRFIIGRIRLYVRRKFTI